MAVIAKRSGMRKRHEDILATMKAPTALSLRPLGQAAKTAPSHGAIGSSILPRVTILFASLYKVQQRGAFAFALFHSAPCLGRIYAHF